MLYAELIGACRARSCKQRCCRPLRPAACMMLPSHTSTAMSLRLVGWARSGCGTCTAGASCCACLCPTWTAAVSPSCRSVHHKCQAPHTNASQHGGLCTTSAWHFTQVLHNMEDCASQVLGISHKCLTGWRACTSIAWHFTEILGNMEGCAASVLGNVT